MDSTEEQQVERIKEFWKEHGKGIVAGAIIGFGLFYGWRYYDAQTQLAQETASAQYEQLATQVAESDDESAALAQIQAFVEQQDETIYTDLAAFQLAQRAVNNDDLATAVSALQQVRDSSGSEAFKALASLRQARVLMAQEQYDAALQALNSSNFPASYQALTAELKGDIYLAQGNDGEARSAYQQAVDAGQSASPVLQMKLDNLASAS